MSAGRRSPTAVGHPTAVDEDRFRRALAVHAAGVVVITAETPGGPAGLTATSFTSVSLDPPLVSFYVDRSSTTWPGLRLADHFGVNILAREQREVAVRFARRGADRFAGTPWRAGPWGVPLLGGVTAHLVCAAHRTVELGDHVLVVGEVTDTSLGPTRHPLLYQQGTFGRFIPYT
ncbi:flavin reductase family protein [Rhizohabitans arisaemae]|uniref:flavin reductase family protein n=1 Tax=Rhizohabitans arisaemae TaxID=2720610 RepID=UPI0024B08746|nr:flavin reductase family protein [Rhizohabitans arisaemae]